MQKRPRRKCAAEVVNIAWQCQVCHRDRSPIKKVKTGRQAKEGTRKYRGTLACSICGSSTVRMDIHLKAVDKMVRGTEDFSKAMDATLPYHPKSVAEDVLSRALVDYGWVIQSISVHFLFFCFSKLYHASVLCIADFAFRKTLKIVQVVSPGTPKQRSPTSPQYIFGCWPARHCRICSSWEKKTGVLISTWKRTGKSLKIFQRNWQKPETNSYINRMKQEPNIKKATIN